MSLLTSLMEKVREKDLTKSQLDDYFQEATDLHNLVQLEMAEKEKEEALYIDASEEKTDAARKRKWQVTPSGLRLIELKRYEKVLIKLLSSLKHRIFSGIM